MKTGKVPGADVHERASARPHLAGEKRSQPEGLHRDAAQARRRVSDEKTVGGIRVRSLNDATGDSQETEGLLSSSEEEERRQFPRVAMDLATSVTGPQGKRGAARMIDLSRGGLQLAFDRRTAGEVFPNGSIRPGDMVVVSFRLCGESVSPRVVKVRCRVVWPIDVGDHECRVGLQFVAFKGQGYQDVELYIGKSLLY